MSCEGKRESKVPHDQKISLSRSGKRSSSTSMSTKGRSFKKTKFSVTEEDFNIRGKANVPLKKTAMIAVSSRTGRARKLTYRGEYTYEGSGLGVGDVLLQTQERYGELKKVGSKKRTREGLRCHQKNCNFIPIDETFKFLSELGVVLKDPNIDLQHIRSYLGSVFTKGGSFQADYNESESHAHPKEIFKVTDLCLNDDFQGVLFFQYYSISKHPTRCPSDYMEFECSDCIDMVCKPSHVTWIDDETRIECKEIGQFPLTLDELARSGGEKNFCSENGSGDDDNTGDEEELETRDDELRRPIARNLFASRVFEAAKSFKTPYFSAKQILIYIEAEFDYNFISQMTLSQGIRRCVFLGQLIERKEIPVSSTSSYSVDHMSDCNGYRNGNMFSTDELHVPKERMQVESICSKKLVSIDVKMYSVNPLFKGFDYESAVLCTSLHGVYIQTFSSVAETSEFFQIDEELVRKLCHGLTRKSLGILLRYASNGELQAVQNLVTCTNVAKNRETGSVTTNYFPRLWSIHEAWSLYGPETKSQTRKRLQKSVHSCVEVLHSEKIPVDAFIVYRRIAYFFAGRGIHPIHVEEVLQVLTSKGFLSEEVSSIPDQETEEEKKTAPNNLCDDLTPVWRRDNEREMAGTLPGWPLYTLSPGYKIDYETAAVIAMSSDDEPLKLFSSINDSILISSLSLDKGAILKVLFGKQSSHKGLRFKWASDLNEFEKEELAEQHEEDIMQRLDCLTNTLTVGGKKDSDRAVSVRKTNRISLISSKLSGIYEVDDAHHSRRKLKSLLCNDDDKSHSPKKIKMKKLSGHDFDNYFAVSLRAYCARHEVDVHNFHADVERFDFTAESLTSSAQRFDNEQSISSCDDTKRCNEHKSTGHFEYYVELESFLRRCRKLSIHIGAIVKVKLSFSSCAASMSDIDDSSSSVDNDEGMEECRCEHPQGSDVNFSEVVIPCNLERVDMVTEEKHFVVKTVCIVSDFHEHCDDRVEPRSEGSSINSTESFVTAYDGVQFLDVNVQDVICVWHEEQGNLIDKWCAHYSKRRPDSVESEECCVLRDWRSHLIERQFLQWTETEVGDLISGLGSRHRSGSPNMTRMQLAVPNRTKKEILKMYYAHFCIKTPQQKYTDIKAVFRCAESLRLKVGLDET